MKFTRIIILLVLIAVPFMQAGCAFVTFQGYAPNDVNQRGEAGRLDIKITDEVMLRTYLECDPKYILGIGTAHDSDITPDYCNVSVTLFGLTSIQFEFVNNQIELKDGNGQKIKYKRLNTSTMEGGREQFGIFGFLDANYSYLRGFSTGFLLGDRPPLLGVVVPDVIINGAVHKIPMLKFTYWEKTEFRHLLQGG